MRLDPVYRARMIAMLAHEGQTDMAGKPYFEHCERVANNVTHWFWSGADNKAYTRQFKDDCKAVAFLHDVVEDTDWTIDDLENLGHFNLAVVTGVDAMTQRYVHPYDPRPDNWRHDASYPNGDYVREPLEDYWARVKANPHARIVKVHGDIPDNNNPKRKEHLSAEKQAKLTDKYARALEFLGDTNG